MTWCLYNSKYVLHLWRAMAGTGMLLQTHPFYIEIVSPPIYKCFHLRWIRSWPTYKYRCRIRIARSLSSRISHRIHSLLRTNTTCQRPGFAYLAFFLTWKVQGKGIYLAFSSLSCLTVFFSSCFHENSEYLFISFSSKSKSKTCGSSGNSGLASQKHASMAIWFRK